MTETTPEKKHPGGRPTKYDPAFCDKVIELLREGADMVEIAFELYVTKETLYQWMKIYPEFSDSIKQGRDFSEGWWKKKGRSNLDGKEFNSTLWYMNMKNRFGWSDKQEQTINATIKQEDSLKDLE